ncbi:MAG: hypothetical protein K2O09_01200 [Treponemataceae bacterium]|nr:hypothetical protein [Treponemataceae bacterium]
MKKIAPCAVLLAFALAFVGCNLQDEPEQSDTLQDALNAGGSVNLDDHPFSRDKTYTISGTSTITGDAKGTSFIIADGADVTFDGTKDIGTVTAGSTTSFNAAVRAASRSGGIKISLKGSGVKIGKVFIKVDCTFASDNADNSFGSVVVAKTVTSLKLEGQTNVSALVSAGESNIKITVSAEVTIEKADATVIDSVKENNSNITINIPKISDDELKKLQDAFEEDSKKNPADDNPSNTTPGNNEETNPKVIPRGSRIAATYDQKVEFAFYREDIGYTGPVIMTMGWSVSGRYTDMGNGDLTLHIPLKSDESDEVVYLAKFNGDTMTLYYYDENGNLIKDDPLTLTKKATNSDPSAMTEWEGYGPLSLTFALDGTVQFFEDSALCWTGTYTVTEDDTAVTNDIRQVGTPWGEDDRTSPPLKVEFDFTDKDALSPNVYTSEGSGWSPFLTQVGDMTVKAPTSGGNTSGTPPGNNGDNTNGTNPGNNDGNTSGTTTGGNNGDNTGGTTTGGNGDDDKSDDEHDAGAFKNGAIDATYMQKVTLTFADGIVTYGVKNLNTDNSTSYTQDGEARTFDFAKLTGANDDDMQIQATATIFGDTLTLKLTSTWTDDNGEIQTSSGDRIFKKSSTGTDTWEYALKLSLSSQKTVAFYEQDKLCWTGNYEVTDERHATVSNVTIADQAIFDSIFGNGTKVDALWDGDNTIFWICCNKSQDGCDDIGILK